jgi:hypothetical protein
MWRNCIRSSNNFRVWVWRNLYGWYGMCRLLLTVRQHLCWQPTFMTCSGIAVTLSHPNQCSACYVSSTYLGGCKALDIQHRIEVALQHDCPDWLWDPPNGYRDFPQDYVGRGVNLTTHIRLRRGYEPMALHLYFLSMASWCGQGKIHRLLWHQS